MTRAKRCDRLTVRDFQKHPVWEFANDLEAATGTELMMRPVADLPVTTLSNRIVGTMVTLHNGATSWASLSNVTLTSLHSTEQFLTVSLEYRKKWFTLARYFDVDYDRRGPAQLADFLRMTIADVFPIAYDISTVAFGLREVTAGLIRPEPPARLSQEEIIRLSLE